MDGFRRADRRHSPSRDHTSTRSPEFAGLVHHSPLRALMKLSTRPFMVEIKNRKRATSLAASSFTRRDDWLDPICPDALPQRDGHEGLTVAPAQSQALREAEKVFQGLRGSGQTAPAESEPTTAAISSEFEVATPRVLPDLRTAAGEAKREDVRQPRRNGAANRSTEGQPRKKVSAKPLRVPAAGTTNEPAPALYSSDHAEAAMALSRRMNASRTKLPPGQRWRERRLPSVCWGRGRRKGGSAVTLAAFRGLGRMSVPIAGGSFS